MKKIAFFLFFLAIATCGFSQDYTATKEKDTEDIGILFGKKKSKGDRPHIDMGWTAGLNTAYTQFDKKNMWLLGMNIGVILDHNWTLGLQAQGIVNSSKLDYVVDSTDANLVGGYGGFLFQYTLFPKSVVHVTFPVMIGGGYLGYLTGYGRSWDNNGNNNWDNYHEVLDYDVFFFVEPGVQAEINLLKFMRLAIGASYRYSPNFDLYDPDTKDIGKTFMNGFNFTAGLKFGMF
jgi:hypothetical protein